MPRASAAPSRGARRPRRGPRSSRRASRSRTCAYSPAGGRGCRCSMRGSRSTDVRYLALDVGDRRIGLAVGDDAFGLTRALPTLRRARAERPRGTRRRRGEDRRSEPIYRGPVRAPARRRGPPPRKRSSTGPLVFVLLVVVAAVAAFLLARPLATDAIVQAADDHDTLLRQSAGRAFIAPTLAPLVHAPADPNGTGVAL